MGNIIPFPSALKSVAAPVLRNAGPIAPLDPQAAITVACANEVVSTAVWTAMTTGIINRCYLHKGNSKISCLDGCVPPHPVIFVAASRELSQNKNVRRLIDRAKQFYDFLEAARVALTVELRSNPATSRRNEVLRLRICDLWQSASAAALPPLYEIQDLEDYHHAMPAVSTIPQLCEALILAKDGGLPFHESGTPKLPEWAEQRLSKRYVLNTPAFMTRNGVRSSVIAVNISIQGIGLDLVPKGKPGELISIELETGRRFVGSVVWCENNRAGIRFRKALRPTDPLLAG